MAGYSIVNPVNKVLRCSSLPAAIATMAQVMLVTFRNTDSIGLQGPNLLMLPMGEIGSSTRTTSARLAAFTVVTDMLCAALKKKSRDVFAVVAMGDIVPHCHYCKHYGRES